MILVHPVRTLSLVLVAVALVVLPLASPLLVSLCLVVGGLLAAWSGAAGLIAPATA